jgi:hypothetical protein
LSNTINNEISSSLPPLPTIYITITN